MLADPRLRQTRKDDLIRKKLESDLSKRKNKLILNQPADLRFHQINEGSVLQLKPLVPFTMSSETSVLDAAQYMTAFRKSCCLVVDQENSVCGIFTAKDLAFKVIAEQEHTTKDLRRHLTVKDIMTPDPLCVNSDESAIDALNLMVSRGFRHLPISDQNGEIIGILDITKCFFEAMIKLEKAVESSERLKEALSDEFGANHPSNFISYVEALKEHTSGPELGKIIDLNRVPISVGYKSTVQQAASEMLKHNVTSILITDKDDQMAGIFTTKDIVLRVLAANLDPKCCSVVRVMTPNPECAPTSMNIQSALRKMHEGKFLNLPVKNEEGEILAVVDILKLTYATLQHLNEMTACDMPQPTTLNIEREGPAWNKFWMSLDTEPEVNEDVNGFMDLELDSQSQISDTELAQFSLQDETQSNISIDLMPEDSLSRLGISNPLPSSSSTQLSTSRQTFSFKFKAPSGRAHRIQVLESTDIPSFRSLIAAKLAPQDLEKLGGADKFAVSYLDDDKDVISITSVQDIHDAMELSQTNKAEIYLHHPDENPIVKPKEEENGVVPMLVGSAAAMMFGLMAWGRK